MWLDLANNLWSEVLLLSWGNKDFECLTHPLHPVTCSWWCRVEVSNHLSLRTANGAESLPIHIGHVMKARNKFVELSHWNVGACLLQWLAVNYTNICMLYSYPWMHSVFHVHSFVQFLFSWTSRTHRSLLFILQTWRYGIYDVFKYALSLCY